MNAFARAQPASAPPRPLERLRSLLPAETAPCAPGWAALVGRQHFSRGITGSAAAPPSAPCPVGTRGPQPAARSGAGGSAARPPEQQDTGDALGRAPRPCTAARLSSSLPPRVPAPAASSPLPTHLPFQTLPGMALAGHRWHLGPCLAPQQHLQLLQLLPSSPG